MIPVRRRVDVTAAAAKAADVLDVLVEWRVRIEKNRAHADRILDHDIAGTLVGISQVRCVPVNAIARGENCEAVFRPLAVEPHYIRTIVEDHQMALDVIQHAFSPSRRIDIERYIFALLDQCVVDEQMLAAAQRNYGVGFFFSRRTVEADRPEVWGTRRFPLYSFEKLCGG